MNINPEKTAEKFLELASMQRLNILMSLKKDSLNISKLAVKLDATKPEIHRNVNRLSKEGFIEKNSDGNYQLTTIGDALLVQIPSLTFMLENKPYFSKHIVRNLESKFIQRLGALHERKNIKGFVKVLERWKKIHENADKYIYNILVEVPYSSDVMGVILEKLSNNVKIKSIFAENAVIPEERQKIYEEMGFQKFVQNGSIERKIKKHISAGVIVSDKEAAVFFPNLAGELDFSEMLVSSDPEFHEWCYDYFQWCWKNSSIFQESKLKE